MNLMDYDRSFVRQRNEELLREVRTQHIEKRLRAGGETSEDGLRQEKGVLSGRHVVRRLYGEALDRLIEVWAIFHSLLLSCCTTKRRDNCPMGWAGPTTDLPNPQSGSRSILRILCPLSP
jgi:hypothetical protein